MLQGLSSYVFGNKQFGWPPLQSLPTEVDFNRGRPTHRPSNKEVAPGVFLFVALNHETALGMPLRVK